MRHGSLYNTMESLPLTPAHSRLLEHTPLYNTDSTVSTSEWHAALVFFGTFGGIWDQPNDNPGLVSRCPADIFSNSISCEIQWPGMLNARNIVQVSLFGWRNVWENGCPGRKLIRCIPPPFTRVQLTLYSVTFWVCQAHQFEIELRLKWEMFQKEVYMRENIAVILCSEDMWMNFNSTLIA